MKIKVRVCDLSNLFEVAVIDRRGRTIKVEKHKEPEGASMAAKYLSVAFECPIDDE